MKDNKEKMLIPTIEVSKPMSEIEQIAKEYGKVIIVKNGTPQFVMFDVEDISTVNISDDDKIDIAAIKILNEHKAAFEELAK